MRTGHSGGGVWKQHALLGKGGGRSRCGKKAKEGGGEPKCPHSSTIGGPQQLIQKGGEQGGMSDHQIGLPKL